MGPTEVIARRKAGKCVGCNHDVHPTQQCPDQECGCVRGVEELLALDELGL